MEFEHKMGALDDEGLVVADKEKRNWKGLIIALLVISSIMGAIGLSIYLCTPDNDVDVNKAKLELEPIVTDQYRVQSFNGSWLSGHEIVFVDQNGSIVIFDAQTNKSSTMLVQPHDKTLHTMEAFKLSPDRRSILFVSDKRYEFGALVSARYAIFNISSQTVEFLDDLVKANNPLKTPHIQYAQWGPVNGSNSLVFIESNDLYYIPDFAANSNGLAVATAAAAAAATVAASSSDRAAAEGKPPEGKYLRLTKTGALSESMRNGIPDSLYRASIFNQKEDEATLWWSPDGRYLAYLVYDDARVEPSPIEYYDNYLHDANYSPKIHYERLPRAGGLNPRVSLHVADLATSLASDEIETSIVMAPTVLLDQQQTDPRLGHYVTYVGWLERPQATNSSNNNNNSEQAAKPNQLLVIWSNRAQSVSILSACENTNERGSLFGSRANSWKCDLLTTFSQRIPPSTNANNIILSTTNADGARLMFFALPRPDSVIGDHYHVAMLREGERAPKYLTHGEFDVDRLISYEPATDTLYFEAKISERAERHLYQFSSIGHIGGSHQERHTKCLTCQLKEPCGYNYAHISPGARFLVHECLGPSVPVTRLRLLTGNNEHNTYYEMGSGEGGEPKHGEDVHVRRLHSNKQQANGTGGGGASEQRADKTNSRIGAALAAGGNLESVATIGTNANIEALIKSKLMPIEKFLVIKSTQQTIPCDIYLKLYLPNEIEEEKDKRYPMLIEISELDQRNVWTKYELDWGKYLASRKQIIYAKMDCIRPRQLTPMASIGLLQQQQQAAFSNGMLDEDQLINSSPPLFNAKDQADAIKHLAENIELFPYIDRRRIAVFGPTSTSAYMALATTINDDSKLIQCTMAVSPITNWRYMSSYLAEHYLGLPWLDGNSLKYERANLLKRSVEFSLRKLLIIHGTADEQVHVQHSMQFLKSLTDHHITGAVLHQAQFYPDIGHSFNQVKKHFYLTLDGFVDRCFYQKPIAIKATEWRKSPKPKVY